MNDDKLKDLTDTKNSSHLDYDDELEVKQSNVDFDIEEAEYEWESENEDEEEGAETQQHIVKKDFVRKAVFFDQSAQQTDKATKERRKTIYELDSFGTSTLLTTSIDKHSIDLTDIEEQKTRVLERFSKSLGISEIGRIRLSPLTQKILGCVIDENVTTEFPWITVHKEIIEDNLNLHSESSDFLPLKKKILSYPDSEILMGYAPTLIDDNDFYVCLSKDSRNAVLQHIEQLRMQQQQRILSSVQKFPKEWHHLGSEDIIKESFVKKSRPLYEIEVDSTINQLKTPITLADKTSDNQRDDYVEVVPERETFTNVMRVLVNKASEELPISKENGAQTEASMPVNAVCQCLLDKEVKHDLDYINFKNLEKFVKHLYQEICIQVETNSTWDMYKNDYMLLDVNSDSAEIALMTRKGYEERQNFYNGQVSEGRLINDLAWHPQWTGVMAATYTTISKCENLVGPKTLDETNQLVHQVLVWSFDDCLKPKLILESKRDVTAVSFCPSNGNIIVGGCCNGQIVIWDITGKIEEVEKIIVRTAAQVKHHILVKNLTTWMKETHSSSMVKPTATSSLQFSQKGPITKIKWLSPYNKLDDRGILHELPEDSAPEDLSLQFIASSEDGSIAFWDLNWRPPEDPKKEKETRRKKKTAERSASLVQSISPLKVLDGIFKPLYILIIQNATEIRNAVITTINFRGPELEYEQVPPFSKADDIITRKYYKVIMKKHEEKNTARIFVGTARGVCGVISWEGYEFSTGITLNKEICKWVWVNQIHDGPVYRATRSQHLKDIILTVGGRIFAIWREDFKEPIIWRKCEQRYTACCWDNNKPTVFILGRSDGTVETWDMFIKSHEPNNIESLSGRIITGIYAHELPLNPQCIAFCDYNGALRIFLAPKVLFESKQSDVKWMRQFVDREVIRNKNYIAWRAEWSKKNLDLSDEETSKQEIVNKEEEAEVREKLLQEEAKIEAARNAKKRNRQTLMEKLRARWVTRELERMQQIILEKKGLKAEELERCREPILRMKREARDKEAKRQRIIETADDLFVDVVGTNFPHYYQKLQDMDPNFDNRFSIEKTSSDEQISKAEQIIQNYEEIEAETLLLMRQTSHDLKFNWQKFISDGINRRRSMDVDLKAHKKYMNFNKKSDKRNSEGDSLLNSIESLDALSKEVPVAESSQIH